MSLDRKDIRAKLDPDAHAKLRAICDAEGVDMGEWIEAQLLPAIEKRVHAAMVIAGALQRQGITGNNRESPGKAGSDRA
jgi:hypothetical protein